MRNIQRRVSFRDAGCERAVAVEAPLVEADVQQGRCPFTIRLAIVAVVCSLLSIVSLPSWLPVPSWFPAPLMCSTVRHTLHPMAGASKIEFVNMLLSPLLVPLAPFSPRVICLGLLNLTALGKLEQAMGTRALSLLTLIWWPSFLGFRILWGHVWSRCIGWTVYWLFFSASSHECGSGLGPLVLAATMFAHLLNKTTRWPVLCAALNVLIWPQSSTWQSLSSMTAIVVIAVATLLFPKFWLDRRAAFKRFASAFLMAFALVAVASLSANQVSAVWKLATAPLPTFPITLLIITGPRPEGARPLEKTLESHIPALVGLKTALPGDVHVNVLVHTSFANDSLFDELRTREWPPFVRFVRQTVGSDALQPHLHLVNAFGKVIEQFPETKHIYLNEDDFPMCSPQILHWKSLLQNMVEVDRRGACGYFFASAQSGVVFRADLLPDMQAAIDSHPQSPTDGIVEQCLRGKFGCEQRCRQKIPPNPRQGSRYGYSGLMVSDRVRLHHIANDFSVWGKHRGWEGVRRRPLQAMQTCDARMALHDLSDALVLPLL